MVVSWYNNVAPTLFDILKLSCCLKYFLREYFMCMAPNIVIIQGVIEIHVANIANYYLDFPKISKNII